MPPLPKNLPVTLSLGDQQDNPFVWIDCVVRGTERAVVALSPRVPLSSRLRDRLEHGEDCYILFEDNGSPIALKGLARTTGDESLLEVLAFENGAAGTVQRADSQPTEGALLRLMYVSRASPGLTAHDFNAILTEANARNARSEITGALCLRNEFFGQILEGPEQSVRDTFALIESDPRHREPVILLEEPAHYRLYGGWTMRGISGEHAITAADELAARLALAKRDDAPELTRRWLELLRAEDGPTWASIWLEGRQSVLVLRELIEHAAPPSGSDG